MLTLREEIGRLGAATLRERFPDASIPDVLSLERSQKSDLQTSAALQLARGLKKPPREIAELIVTGVSAHPAVERAEIAGAGFVNVTLRDSVLAQRVLTCTSLRPVGAGQTIVVDFSSPNVAKPMHIGHIRSTILGEALSRTFRALGYTVVADNHLGDWGTQFGKLLVAWRRWLDQKAFEEAPVAELLRLYVKYTIEEKAQRTAMGVEAKADDEEEDVTHDRAAPEILKAARAELVKLQQGDAENVALWQRFIDVSMHEFNRVYNRLDTHFDVVLGESFYNSRLGATVDRLLAEGIAEHSQGAVVVTFTKERDGEASTPLLIRKADGGFLYGTTDIATVLYREETWKPSRVIYITDERQQLHFRQFFNAARRLGVTTSLEHVWFGLMRLPEGTFSTRDGNTIGLEAMLDEAEVRALAIARESSPDLPEEELRDIARKVGIGAVKYNDFSRDRTTLVTFTWDKALSLTGNTSVYIQYAHARICSILRKASAEGFEAGVVAEMLPAERALAMRLLSFGEVVEEVARSSRPNILCDYLYEVGGALSTLYNGPNILKSEPALRASRLRLLVLTAAVFSRGLDLLGIEAPQRM
jgi:arginyl-tRNA synthetase